jgi:hypothetical protein
MKDCKFRIAYGLGVNGGWGGLWWGWRRRRVVARNCCYTDDESDERGNVGELHVDGLELYIKLGNGLNYFSV